ncbi:MAG TPA: response regulator, partial [Aggregatilineales bacterium]|nr:response regulator [Aggregatilineales bacterium]
MTRRILIVDANINFSLKLKRALEDAGYEIRTVTRLKPAVEAVEIDDFDAVVVDTDLEFTSPTEIIQNIRAVLPRIPAILTGTKADTEATLPQLTAQAFLRKPYLARDLIPVMESVIARGFDPKASESTRENLAQKLANQEREEQIDPLLEATRQNPSTMLTEPPVTADDSTISEMMNVALKPEVSRKIYAYLDNPEATPESSDSEWEDARTPVSSMDSKALLDHPEEQIIPVTATLAATVGTDSLDTLLQEIRNYATNFTRSLEATEKQSGGKSGQ